MNPITRFLGACLLLGVVAPSYALNAPPQIPAQAWLLVDADSGSVLAEHQADAALPPASLTKLMTAYLVFERVSTGQLKLGDPVTVSAHAASMSGSRLFLRPGERVTLEPLLKGMLVRSANDATVALAEHVAGSEPAFVAEMNARARAWGLTHTTYLNSTGLDQPGHRSSARDLSRIAAALRRDFPGYYAWFSLRDFSLHDLRHYNSNALLWRDPSVDGMKTGYTRQAGYCLVTSAKREHMRLIAAVLGAKSDSARIDASQKLLDYGFRNFETRLIYATGRPTAETRVWMGEAETLPLGVAQNLYLTLPRGAHRRLHARLTIKDLLYAPVKQGERVGLLALALDDKVFAEYPLVALRDVRAGGLVQRTLDGVHLWFR